MRNGKSIVYAPLLIYAIDVYVIAQVTINWNKTHHKKRVRDVQGRMCMVQFNWNV